MFGKIARRAVVGRPIGQILHEVHATDLAPRQSQRGAGIGHRFFIDQQGDARQAVPFGFGLEFRVAISVGGKARNVLVDQPAQIATFDRDIQQGTRGVAQGSSLHCINRLAQQLVVVLGTDALAFAQAHQQHTLSIDAADIGQQQTFPHFATQVTARHDARERAARSTIKIGGPFAQCTTDVHADNDARGLVLTCRPVLDGKFHRFARREKIAVVVGSQRLSRTWAVACGVAAVYAFA